MMRVLLADQNPDIRLALAILLNKEPGVTVVGSVSETTGLLALIQSTQPDIIILDSRLPGIPTTELFPAFHSHNQALKILFLGDVLASAAQTVQINAITSKNDPPETFLQKFRDLVARDISITPGKQ